MPINHIKMQRLTFFSLEFISFILLSGNLNYKLIFMLHFFVKKQKTLKGLENSGGSGKYKNKKATKTSEKTQTE